MSNCYWEWTVIITHYNLSKSQKYYWVKEGRDTQKTIILYDSTTENSRVIKSGCFSVGWNGAGWLEKENEENF